MLPSPHEGVEVSSRVLQPVGMELLIHKRLGMSDRVASQRSCEVGSTFICTGFWYTTRLRSLIKVEEKNPVCVRIDKQNFGGQYLDV